MSPSLTTTARLEDRAAELKISVSRLCRLAGVSSRRVWENRIDAEEIARIEHVLRDVEVERARDVK